MHRVYQCLLSGLSFLSAASAIAQNCQLFPPGNLYVSDISSCSATLHWTSNNASAKYSVSYKLSNSAQWSPQIYVGSDTLYHFTGLLPGKTYNFSVKAKCSDGSFSQPKRKNGATSACSLPDEVTVDALNSSTAKISISASCFYSNLHVRYKSLNGPFQVLSFAAADSYLVAGLNYDSTYLFQVSTCQFAENIWTLPDTLHLPAPPNVLFILIDDSRYDYFSCNGAPSFFQTPNIDRIANEGVNFKRSYVVTSLCAPSRASIATGLFTLETGVVNDNIALDTTFMTLPAVMKEHGYYSALVGKNHETFLQGSVPEFNYYLEQVGYEKFDGKKWDYNGELKDIDTEYPRTLTDTTIALIQRVTDPFFIWLAPEIPHIPLRPLPAFVGLYNNYVIPWKDDTARYSVNYPSFLYSSNIQYLHGEDLDTTYRHVLEVIAGLDSCIGEILKALDNTGKLDNTLIIFMSDNGYMEGTHWLEGKTHAYEPSMRVPLFVRYPKWFAPSTIVSDQLANNLDIAPTIYEAAQISYTDPLDGFSLRDLYNGTVSRKSFYYLMQHKQGSQLPTTQAIRDLNFKYIKYSCNSDTTEEFFDMVHDSLEITNLVNNSAYESQLQIYRAKFDSIKAAWRDTVPPPLNSCYIENPYTLKQILEQEDITAPEPYVYPTLSAGLVEVFIPWPSAIAKLCNGPGKPCGEWKLTEPFSQITLSSLPDGIYFLNLTFGEKSFTKKLILAHR